MKKLVDDGEMPEEIDFSNAERVRYAGRVANGETMVLLESDITKVFLDCDR